MEGVNYYPQGCSPNNLRPIALWPTIYKIYSGLQDQAIKDWIERNSILIPAQKGFRPFDGCFEHYHQEVLQKGKSRSHPIIPTDVINANAFGCVLHEAIRPTVVAQGIGNWYGDVVGGMYSGASTCLLPD